MTDALQLLSIYAPTLFDCATRNLDTVERIRCKYRERWRAMAESIQAKGSYLSMATIFDLLWDASEKREGSAEYLQFIDSQTRRALRAAKGHARNQLERLVVSMITTFGSERSEYKNHLSELLVISKLLRDGVYTLACVEKKLPNGKCMDFEVVKDGKYSLIEVYNIDFLVEKVQTAGDFRKFLERRLVEKLESKLSGLSDVHEPCILIPVLWGDLESLKKYSAVFDEFKAGQVIGPFMAIVQRRNAVSGAIGYRFASIQSFLEGRGPNRATGS
jgi:hypothetical protein